MCPALRVPIRTLSRASLRLISAKAQSDICGVTPHSISNSEMSSYGDSVVVLSRTPSQESTDSNELLNQSRESVLNESRNHKQSSRAPSVASSSTDHSQVFSKSCQWVGCDSGADIGPGGLLSHIQEAHVLPQISLKKSRYTCLWSGCKVYGHPSVSSNWLSRHVQEHSEAKGKPFSCIFDRCFQRFSSSSLLQRHIDRDHMRSKAGDVASVTKGPPFSQSIPESPAGGTRNRANFKNCTRRISRRKRKFRFCRIRHVDFYDARSKIIIKNRIVLDKLLAERAIESLIRPPSPSASNDIPLSTHVALPGPIRSDNRESSSPEKRILRSTIATVSGDASASSPRPASRPECFRVKLLLTIPHTFVGQRLTRENKTEYLVKWQGDLCTNIPPVMWVLEEEVRAAAALDKL
ncbi:Zinc finger protein jing protein [Echinococcus multilocularis]|uniref:Zinc finger protein jing protein n=1 Tax=Echinococcus multilocularis TaxID=6211 RepID=A0A068Y8P4_ECHMU|nr:Zinc finger protein jing protein [Echinococcus multilocularis]